MSSDAKIISRRQLGEGEDSYESYEAKVDKASVSFAVNHGKKLVDIYSVRVPQKYRGKGQASAALTYVTQVADDLNYRAKLGASPLDARTNLPKLIKLYERFGFVRTGRSVNFVGDPEMVRASKRERMTDVGPTR